ncbi:helix-turn-helix domain-containing protein [Streptomyces sp. FXJ1.4098]|nr:helix-turn-helix domain-containing protein [Streptomyces sp. FXJ1.4098]
MRTARGGRLAGARTHRRHRADPPADRADGWGSRTLEKRFREQIGLPPKTAARVLRLRRALRLLARGRVPAQVAAASGYCDQAHFTRECTAMTGLPPRRLHLARTASTTALMAHDRMRGEVTSIVLTDQRPSR